MSQTSRTSTNEHLTAINHRTNLARNGGEEQRMWGEPFHRIPVSYLADIESHAGAMAARIERLQRLWDAWGRSRGYAADSKPYGAFLDALKACEDHGDLLPLDGSN